MVPQLGCGVARAGHEDAVLIEYGHAHHVARVVVENGLGALSFNIPQNASRVTTASDDLVVADKAAAGEIPAQTTTIKTNATPLAKTRKKTKKRDEPFVLGKFAVGLLLGGRVVFVGR